VSATWDVMVIGGGAAGLAAARAAAAEGAARVALVERSGRLGGECLHTGCVPSKALIETARRMSDAREGERFGIHMAGLELDFGAAMARVREVISEIGRDDAVETVTAAGIGVLTGAARFTAPGELEVDGAAHRFRRAIIATGSGPETVPGIGLESVPYLTNETIFGVAELPERLIVLGGGATGVELGQAFARLGSRVTVVELHDRLLPHEDPSAGRAVAEALEADGVELRAATRTVGASRQDGGVLLRVEGPGGADRIEGDALLVAVGRRPRSGDLGLERIGVRTDDGWIRVNARMRTDARGVYACGDVTGGHHLTHVGAYEGVIAGRNAAGGRSSADYRVVPSVVFTDPEVARVGLSEDQARRRHRKVQVVEIPMGRVDRARVAGSPRGFVRLITAARPVLGRLGGGQVVGALVVGPAAGEIVHEAVLAMQTRCFAGRLAQAMHAYPTGSMGLQMAALRLFPLGRALVHADPLPPLDARSPDRP
jgi:pyruvate/2-oxoglutarate dehydrogenase complex dihydrolipoamide dehydrogenase (E3) component